VLARAGLGSRRRCEELIAQGRVLVNGRRALLGQRVDPSVDRVVGDGVPVAVAPRLVYFLVNKPRGVVVTVSDPQGRPTLQALLPASPRIFAVGRLDKDSEGLVVCTNDGELAHRLAHPRFGVEKEYLAEVAGQPGRRAIARLRAGVELDGRIVRADHASTVAPRTVRLVVHEGRKHVVRRMLAAVGYPVERLVRTRIGPLSDPRLPPGAWRPLTPSEVRALYEATAPQTTPRLAGLERARAAVGEVEDAVAPTVRADGSSPDGRPSPGVR